MAADDRRKLEIHPRARTELFDALGNIRNEEPVRYELSAGQAKLILLAVVAFVLTTGAFAWISESRAGAITALALAAAFIIGSIAYAVVRGRRVTDVVVDEGGLRLIPRSGAAHYVSFDEMKTAVTWRSFGGLALRLGTQAGKRDYVLETPPEELQVQLDGGMRRVHAPGEADSLARNGQSLDVWLTRLRDLATPDYRARPIDPEALVSVIENCTAPVELRAAAAHVLVWLRDHDRATRVMAMLGRSTPPLVLVAATLATKHGTYVAEYEEALAYLSPADRAVAARMIDERPLKLRVSASETASEDVSKGVSEAENEDVAEEARRGTAP